MQQFQVMKKSRAAEPLSLPRASGSFDERQPMPEGTGGGKEFSIMFVTVDPDFMALVLEAVDQLDVDRIPVGDAG